MSRELSYDEVMEMLPAYVLGALEMDEMLAIDAYLQRHHLLEERLQKLQESTAQIALAAPIATPPPRAKEALMARIRSEAPSFRQDISAQERRKSVNPLLRRSPDRKKTVSSTSSPQMAPQAFASSTFSGRRFHFRGATVGWAAAALMAALMLLAIILTSALYQNRIQALQQEIAFRDRQLEEMNRQMEALQEQFWGLQNQLAAFTHPDRIIPLTGTEAAPEVRGIFLHKDRDGILFVRGLQPLPASQTYQLWLIPAEGSPISAGLLGTDGAIAGVHSIVIPQNAENFAAVGISIEPEGGSPLPTGPIVALG